MGGPPRGAAFLDKLYVIFFPNYFEQSLLICYIAYLLIVNHLIVLPKAQVAEMGPPTRLRLDVFPRV